MSGWKIFFNLMQILQKNYNKENNEQYFNEVDVQYLEKLHDLHNDLLFLQKG